MTHTLSHPLFPSLNPSYLPLPGIPSHKGEVETIPRRGTKVRNRTDTIEIKKFQNAGIRKRRSNAPPIIQPNLPISTNPMFLVVFIPLLFAPSFKIETEKKKSPNHIRNLHLISSYMQHDIDSNSSIRCKQTHARSHPDFFIKQTYKIGVVESSRKDKTDRKFHRRQKGIIRKKEIRPISMASPHESYNE